MMLQREYDDQELSMGRLEQRLEVELGRLKDAAASGARLEEQNTTWREANEVLEDQVDSLREELEAVLQVLMGCSSD